MIDNVHGLLLGLLGQMGIDGGGFGRVVAKVYLDLTEIDACFQEMGGKAVSKGSYGGEFVNAAFSEGEAKGILNVTIGHGYGGGSPMDAAPAGSREDPDGIMMGLPVLTQDGKGGLRQWYIAVFAAFAVADMNDITGTVDILNFEVGTFL